MMFGVVFVGCDNIKTQVKIEYHLTSLQGASIAYDTCSVLHNGRCNSRGNINVIRNGSESKQISGSYIFGKKIYFMLSSPVRTHVRLYRDNKLCAENTYETVAGETTEFILDCEPQ
jgi:hypothetical protein